MQAARYWLKQRTAHSTVATYLTAASFADLGALEAAFEQRALHISSAVHTLMDAARGSGRTGAEVWNVALVDASRLSRARAELTLLCSFRGKIERITDRPVREALAALCNLFALSTLLAHLGDFMEAGCLLPADVPAARARVLALFARIRPDAVALVEAWDFSDHLLDSAIGSSDGRVYERLMEAARREPLNHAPARERFEQVLRPMMRGKL